ncbi:MAG: hypothetical protein LBQ30_06160 [Treponema sp.]|nr:hypothetical protein [Treponema sp.]
MKKSSRCFRGWGRPTPWLLLGVAFFLSSCATAPKTTPPDPFTRFPQGALVYLAVDAVKARPILEAIPKSQAIPSAVLDRTATIHAAFYPAGGERRFLAAARGRYPNFRAGISLAFNARWKKRRSATGGSYWYSAQEDLGISLGTDQVLVSDGDPYTAEGASFVQVPEGFAAFSHDAALAGWITEGAMPLNQLLSSLELPLRIPAGQVLFNLQQSGKSGNHYEAMIRLETPSASQAKALVMLFSLARPFILATPDPSLLARVLFMQPPVLDDRSVNLRTGALDAQEVALLFSLFSVYSK